MISSCRLYSQPDKSWSLTIGLSLCRASPNSSYTRYKLDHKHDPYPSPSLVNIYGGSSSSGPFTVPGHTYNIGLTELRVSTWSTWWLATATTQGNSYSDSGSAIPQLSIIQHQHAWILIHGSTSILAIPAHGSIQNQPIFIAYTAIPAHGSIQNQPIYKQLRPFGQWHNKHFHHHPPHLT